MKEAVYGTCDFRSVLAEKLQSHYASKHGLSTHDASVLAYGNLGFDLSNEQRHMIDDHLEGFKNNPSNSNKFRHSLYAEVEELVRERA